MSLEPTEADIEWMTNRAIQLREARLKKLGKGAKLCRAEEDAILVQALEDGEKHAREVRMADEERQRIARHRADDQLRAEGKPTLRASFADLLAAKGITRAK